MIKIPFYNLTVTDGFWAELQKRVRQVTERAVYDRFAETGRIATMDCKPHPEFEKDLHVFWGSDVFKWMEGAAYLYELHPDEELRSRVERIIDAVEDGIREDGYYNSYFNVHTEKPRFADRADHELYSLGHMIEAAVAWTHATGDERFLTLCRRNVDLVDEIFRRDGSAGFVTPGHEEIELALVRLYDLTGEERYLRLAAFFVDQRGNNTQDQPVFPALGNTYEQSDRPARQLTLAVGHAVRAVYYYCALVDLGERLADKELLDAAERVFTDIYTHKMYITGGIGSVITGEAFSEAYHLPNREAYAETCAALGLALFASRMYTQNPDGRYGDAAERALYNGMLSGLSLSGDRFFYENALTVDPTLNTVPGLHHAPAERVKVFDCSCCPPNLVRMIPSVAGLAYTVQEDTLFVHQYISTKGTNGDISVQMETNYPVDGTVQVTASGVRRLALRHPAWCTALSADQPYTEQNGYLYFETTSVTVRFDMIPHYIVADHRVADCTDCVALMRGPIVYALEQQDQPAALTSLRICPEVIPQENGECYGGLPVLFGEGVKLPSSDALYQPYAAASGAKIRLRFVPYYTFANRGADCMRVWNPLYKGKD